MTASTWNRWKRLCNFFFTLLKSLLAYLNETTSHNAEKIGPRKLKNKICKEIDQSQLLGPGNI